MIKNNIYALYNYYLENKSLNMLFSPIKLAPTSQNINFIYYHRVGFDDGWSTPPIRPNDFEYQIKYLRRRYKIASISDQIDYYNKHGNLPRNNISISFDDGYKDNYNIACKILSKYNIKATFFITANNIDKNIYFWWDEVRYYIHHSKKNNIVVYGKEYNISNRINKIKTIHLIENILKNINEDKKKSIIMDLSNICGVEKEDTCSILLNWDNIKEMNENGMEIGSHSFSHPILTNLKDEKIMKKEISDSKKIIERNINGKINYFSYPNGKKCDYNNKTIDYIKNEGYLSAFTTSKSSYNKYELGRIYGGWDINSFHLNISKVANIW